MLYKILPWMLLAWVQPRHAQPAYSEETVEDKKEDRSNDAGGGTGVRSGASEDRHRHLPRYQCSPSLTEARCWSGVLRLGQQRQKA